MAKSLPVSQLARIIGLVAFPQHQNTTLSAAVGGDRLSFGQKLYRSISTPRIAVAGLFASTVAFMLLLAGDGMEILTSVRGFVAAEARWSAAERDAVLYLNRYAATRDENDYRKFRAALEIPLVSEEIRLQLANARPDYEAVKRLARSIGPASWNAEGMLTLHQRFQNVAYMRRAFQYWAEANQGVLRLEEIGAAMHRHFASDKAADTEYLAGLLSEVDQLQDRIPRLANAFSETFGEGATVARDLFKWTIAISAALLLTLGILITWRLLSEAIEAKEKYRQMINSANDAILVVNRDTGRIVEANLKSERMTGVAADDLIGYPLRELITSDVDGAVEAMLRGEPPADGLNPAELLVHNANGNATPVEASVNLTTLGGKAVVQSLLRDVSDRKRLEAQLRQAAKMDAVGRLAGGVAHDFNNLLTVISGYGELLQTQIAPEDPIYVNIEQIMKAADRATSLTKQLLAFSRHHMMKPKILDLNEVVGGVEKMLHRLIGENIALEFVPANSLGHVKADQSQLEQVIVNLAVNARDAMPEGGRLTIRTRNIELSEKQTSGHPFLKPGSYVCLSVSDNGTGMDEKTTACIFEPFFTTKESGKGTGLGLAMVYGTVKQSGGYVLVQSQLGRGTTFDIYLPRVNTPKAEQLEQQPSIAGGGAETILIVEDQTELRALLRTVLQRNGYTVLEAPDGRMALAEYQQHASDIALVLTDMVMPEMGGVDLGTRLRANARDLKILYISGYTDSLLPRQAIPKGAAFLQKPFTPEVLARKVRDVLDGRTEQSEATPQPLAAAD